MQGKDERRGGDDPAALWPERIQELACAWRSEHDPAAKARILAEVWILIGLALRKYIRLSSRAIPREDVCDLAADKAMDLVARLEQSSWDPSASSPAQICAFVASVARHGVIDLLRARGREVSGLDEGDIEEPPVRLHLVESPSAATEQARAILACSQLLTPRSRSAWYLRVFLELSSADIARHPEVASTPSAVDTMLLRSRDQMRTCMSARGFSSSHFPPGTYAALWRIMVEDSAVDAPAVLEGS